MISLAGRDILHTLGQVRFHGDRSGTADRGDARHGRGLSAAWSMTAKPCSTTAGPICGWCKRTPGSVCGIVQPQRRRVPRGAGHARCLAGGQRDLPDHAGAQGHGGREQDVRAMVVGIAPGQPGSRPAGRPTSWRAGRSRAATTRRWPTSPPGFKLGERIAHSQRALHRGGPDAPHGSSSGDPMVFIPLEDAQEAQFLKDNDAIWQSRRRTEANPVFNRPGRTRCSMP